jgi:hypothetical protein
MNEMLGCLLFLIIICCILAVGAMAVKILLFILWVVGATLYVLTSAGMIILPTLVGLFILYKLGRAAFR